MLKNILIAILFTTFVTAQTKTKKTDKNKTTTTNTNTPAVVVNEPNDAEIEARLIAESLLPDFKKDKIKLRKNDSLRAIYKAKRLSFYVRTKKPTKAGDKFQLCYNLVHKDTNLLTCFNDSLCKDPEVAKILFEQQKGDTNYVLVFVDAFTKSKSDGGVCNAGKETKLSFVRWNTKTNMAKWKTKNINSCLKTITNMTKEPIADWDKASVLTINYHRGSNFYELKFDPQNPQLGLQSTNDSDSK